MLEIHCSGTPYQIGHQHGTHARALIAGSIGFYAALFKRNARRAWPQVLEVAAVFEERIRERWGRFWWELRGIADGSGHSLLDIVALNVRTEIAYGLFSDGCTSAYAKTGVNTLMGQNWDWQPAQKAHLVHLTITPADASIPTICMITEAGLIGKIGLNSAGVGVCFNALTSPGIDSSRLPAHLALRVALESRSAAAAAAAVERLGAASAYYILVGDADGAVGLECTSRGVRRQRVDERRRLWHANHLLLEHGAGVVEKVLWKDTRERVRRMGELLDGFASSSSSSSSAGGGGGKDEGPAGSAESLEQANEKAHFSRIFEDEQGYPVSICRKAKGGDGAAETLFNIVIDLRRKSAVVRVGRPCEVEETIVLGREWSDVETRAVMRSVSKL